MRSPIVEEQTVLDMQQAASKLVDLQRSRSLAAPNQPRSLAAVARSLHNVECAPAYASTLPAVSGMTEQGPPMLSWHQCSLQWSLGG